MLQVKIYTKKGDDGTTGLLYGGRISKADAGPEAYGTVDEAVAALGIARAAADGDLAERILAVQRAMFVVGAELATDPANRDKLEDGLTRVTTEMVGKLERSIDEVVDIRGLPTEFVVPGGSAVAAGLDLARTIVRRAERRSVAAAVEGQVVPFLNRLADYLYVLARLAEAEWVPSKESS